MPKSRGLTPEEFADIVAHRNEKGAAKKLAAAYNVSMTRVYAAWRVAGVFEKGERVAAPDGKEVKAHTPAGFAAIEALCPLPAREEGRALAARCADNPGVAAVRTPDADRREKQCAEMRAGVDAWIAKAETGRCVECGGVGAGTTQSLVAAALYGMCQACLSFKAADLPAHDGKEIACRNGHVMVAADGALAFGRVKGTTMTCLKCSDFADGAAPTAEGRGLCAKGHVSYKPATVCGVCAQPKTTRAIYAVAEAALAGWMWAFGGVYHPERKAFITYDRESDGLPGVECCALAKNDKTLFSTLYAFLDKIAGEPVKRVVGTPVEEPIV